jgi:hypothetical protein
MSHCTRFEVYLPVLYTVEEKNESGLPIIKTYGLDSKLVARFTGIIRSQYHGVTQAHPESEPALKGWWQQSRGGPIDVDHLTYLHCLVRTDQTDGALTFFNRWKNRLEARLHQKVILVVHYTVQTIGNLWEDS